MRAVLLLSASLLMLIVSVSCGTPSPGGGDLETRVAELETQVAQAETVPATSAPPSDIATPSPSPVATDTPIPTATATFPPTVTPSSARGFTIYENGSLGFSAEYPEGWGVQVHDFLDPQTGQAIGKAAEFYSPYDPDGSMLQLLDIAVQVIAGIPGSTTFIPTEEEYRQSITDWVTERQQEMVTEPTLVTVDGYTAVQVTYTGTDAFEKYSLVGYGTMLMTEDRFVYVEGVAATENQEEMRNIYEHFMSTFDLLPLP